jgi:heme-degrading monooxygenase HmoA
MHISIRRYKTKPGDAGEAAKRAREGFAPIISKSKGFKAYYVVHLGHDSLSSISVFDTQAEADDSNKAAADWVKANLASLIVGAPEITSGEATAHHSA